MNVKGVAAHGEPGAADALHKHIAESLGGEAEVLDYLASTLPASMGTASPLEPRT